jgi:hypothetical protein
MVYIDGQRIEAGETVRLTPYLTDLPSGVTKVDDAGCFNPIILSQVVTSPTTITVPTTIKGGYQVGIFSQEGETSIKYNTSDNTAAILAEGTGMSVACSTRIIDSIIITPTTKAYVTIERM